MQTQTALQTRTADMPLAGLQMEVRNVTRADTSAGDTAPAARFELVFTTGAPVRRYDWQNGRYYIEQLEVSAEAINTERLVRGAPLLNSHSAYSLEDQIGVCDQPTISKGEGVVQSQLSRRESVRGIVQDLEDRVIRNVSVGYVRDAIEMIAPAELTGMWTYRVTRWTPMEVSLTPIPADMDSQVRSVAGRLQDASGHEVRSYPCAITELGAPSAQIPPTVGISAATPTEEGTRSMTGNTNAAGGTTAPVQSLTPVVAAAAPAAAPTVQDTRAADIADLCARHGMPLLASGMIRAGNTIEQASRSVLDELARRDSASGGHRNVGQIETVRDEMQMRMAGIEQAILHRVSTGVKLDDNGRNYRGMSLLEMGREFLEAHGHSTRGLDRMTLAGRMLNFRAGGPMGTSDFSSLFANVANKRLRSAYDENAGTYALWARKAPNAPDFKSMSVVQIAGAPDLLQVNEAGEFKYGSMSDGKETYGLLTYGRIVSLSRQAIVNDDLRAFERMVSAFGFAARRLENRTVYSQLTANAAMGDTVALFHATHANLITSSALAIATLTAARTAMRLQKGLQSEELNLAPAYLIVPATLEQTAYNLTSANYVPATKGEINEFRAGGRTAVMPIVEPVLDANSTTSWYAAASSSQVDTVEYCYLDGAEGPVIDSEVGFETDGISYKCRLDFAAKAVDHRGLLKATA
ncbi:MAG: Mu-like prophage major head subunit gpT family protein [Rhodoferax sp.]|nr:prohead protease/major capsid protein fusion protein [Rhodoferax sp.]MDP3651054.1 Mu-like prophage major head subunit gpT family protein [Rhodoferax sp.]